jgi:cytochrome c
MFFVLKKRQGPVRSAARARMLVRTCNELAFVPALRIRRASLAIFAVSLAGFPASLLAAPQLASNGVNLEGTSNADHAAELARDAPPIAGADSKVGHYGLGAPASAEQIAGWSIAVLPDGTGLPPGHGSVSQGADIFNAQCAMCHGTFGEGEGRYPKLAGNDKLTADQPDRTIGNFWPYTTSLWDYIDRAMPFPAPHSLSPNDVYAVTAYILNLNNVVPDNFVADAKSLPLVKLANRHGFILLDPRPDTADKACMKDCRKPEDVRITASAEKTGVTPRETGPLDLMKPK